VPGSNKLGPDSLMLFVRVSGPRILSQDEMGGWRTFWLRLLVHRGSSRRAFRAASAGEAPFTPAALIARMAADAQQAQNCIFFMQHDRPSLLRLINARGGCPQRPDQIKQYFSPTIVLDLVEPVPEARCARAD